MVIDTVIQSEINKKENKLYPFRDRRFHPNLTEKPLTGKFYARHDFPDPGLVDPNLEQAILKKKMLLSKDKFKEPLSGNMEYGWYVEPRDARSRFRFRFHFPRRSTWVTRIGALIAMENQSMPKKPFVGVAFKERKSVGWWCDSRKNQKLKLFDPAACPGFL